MKDSYVLPAAADMHVHLRDGDMLKAVVPTIRNGGVDTVYVMPNLVSHTITYLTSPGTLCNIIGSQCLIAAVLA